MDNFTEQYMATALWSSNDDIGDPLDREYSTSDLSSETLESMKKDCEKFQADNEDLLDRAYESTGRDSSLAGHDFWLTRNGHGAGFWDGDWSDFGDELTEACKAFKEVDLYIGSDGKIYIL